MKNFKTHIKTINHSQDNKEERDINNFTETIPQQDREREKKKRDGDAFQIKKLLLFDG
jgi:hypothetical protein